MGGEPASMACRRAVRAELADLAPGTLVLAACSGGADSLALAAALAWVAPRAGLRAGAVCVDHRLQEDSAAVAGRAAATCRELGLDPVHVVSVLVATDSPSGPEAAARTARHTALTATAADLGRAVVVLLGHTADDQAEQVLLGLTRGSGARSLAGMPRRRECFRRPLLDLDRTTTEASCDELGLTPWRDPHNDEPAYLRVRARAALADLTRDLGPGVRAGLLRTAELARADADFLEGEAQRHTARLGTPPWAVADLEKLPQALRGRVWRAALLAAGAPPTDLTRDHVRECDRLLTHWHGQGPITVPGRVWVRRSQGLIHVDADPYG